MSDYHGHKTLIDGTHVPLTEDEAKALWEQVEARRAERAANMPTVEAAHMARCDAREREMADAEIGRFAAIGEAQ